MLDEIQCEITSRVLNWRKLKENRAVLRDFDADLNNVLAFKETPMLGEIQKQITLMSLKLSAFETRGQTNLMSCRLLSLP